MKATMLAVEEEAAVVVESGIATTAVAFFQAAVLRMIPYCVPALVLLLLDLLYGIKAARARGEKVRASTAVRRSMTKCVSYCCWLILASTLALAFHHDWLEWAVLGLVYANELASIIGNYLETKGIEFSFVHFYRWILKLIAGKAGEAMDTAEAEGIIIDKDGKARDKRGRYTKRAAICKENRESFTRFRYMAKYFTLKELCESREATRRSIDNFPSFEIAAHLQELTDKILDPLRWAWGGAINVTSGYRCEALNAAVGGVKTSAHKLGYAADLQPANGRTEDFIAFAREWAEKSHIRFDQFIRERDKSGHVWLHIGLYSPTGSQRGQFLDIVKK